MTLNTQSLNLNARQILFKRLSTAQAIAYTGPLGEVIIDANLKLLRVQDGVTAGGHLMITSNVTANLQAQIDSIKSNLDPAAIDSLTEIMANVTALLANNAESQLINSGFYANLTTTGNLVLDGSLLPKTHVAQDLGSATRSWRNLYISNATAYFGNAALTVTNNGLQVFNSNNQLMPLIGNVRFPDGTIQSTAVDQKVVANIFYLLTPNVSANLNTIHTDVTNAISYFGNLANAAVTTVQANLQSQIDFIKTNIDPAALDSLTEIVASFQNIDANIVSNIGTLGNIVGNLVATKDRLTSGNVQMLLTASAQPSVQFPVGPTGQIIISEAEITALSGNLSLSSMGDAYILSNGDGAAPGAGKLWKFDRSGNLTLPRGSLKRDVVNGFLTVEGPLDADFVAGSGGGINTISNGVKIRTHRVTDDANHDWDFAWDGAVYPPYDSASSQVGAIEWRKSGNVSSQIKYTLGSTVNNVVIPPGLIVNNYAGAGGFTIKADSGAGGSGASKYWTFNPDGSMTTPGLLKSGNIQVATNIYGSAFYGISNAIQLRPNIDVDKRFLFTVDSISGTYIRSGMEMPMAEVDKAVTLAFPHNNSTSGYIFNQGADTNGTEWNDALVIFQNGGNVKIGTITNSNGTKIWEFNQTGNLTLPQTNMNASPAPISLPGITFTDGTFQTTAYTGAAATVNILNTNGLSNTFYPTFVEFRTTGQYVRADVDFTYRSDSNTLTVPKISGMLQGNVDHAGGYINFTGSPSPVSTGIAFADGTSQTTAWTRSAAAVQSTPPASPVTGQLYYDTDDGKTYIWTGSAWVDASPGGSAAPTWQQVTLTGASVTSALYLTNSSLEYTYVVTNNESRNIRLPSSVGLVLGRRFVVRNSGNAGLPIQTSSGTAFNISIYQDQTVIATAANVSVDGTTSWMLEITGSALTGAGAHVMAFSPTITSPTFSGTTKIAGVHEKFNNLVNATGVVNHDCSTAQIFRHTTPAANWTANFTNLNLAGTYATAITILIVQGATAYYPNAVQIQGAAQTINWLGNTTPTPNANRIDSVTFSILNNSGTYTVLGQLTGF